MLYIFRVDTGAMVTLEMGLALETVGHLKVAVESTCNIPQEKQVLLISGGESLEAEERVCKYTAGSSDTNPIFLFSVASIESTTPPSSSVEAHSERDLQPEVEASLSLPDTHNTVAVRASLAQEYVKLSRDQARVCESHIHDQHLQHQGWAAALANLEDCILALQKKFSRFKETYSSYLEKREHYREVIDQFDEDLHVLSKIPVLPALMDEEDSGHGSNGVSTDTSRPPSRVVGGGQGKTLLDWISQAGNNCLESVADSCYRSLEQLDPDLIESLSQSVETDVEGGNNAQMKEIRGLGDRLSGLEQLLLDAKRKVTEQQEQAQTFLQNQARASGLRDNSILPDLCASHRQQLLVMMRNHQHILSIRKRCAKAKEELSINLHTRLKWVMYIQGRMAEHAGKLVLYHEELRRLSRRLEVMEQLHLAPSIYLATLVEVVRRRSFSQQYLKKAGIIAGTFGEVHAEEIRTRQIFQDKLNRHFLRTMFEGMDDFPPDFATIPPADFDRGLPKISLQDLERLRAEFPNIAESLSMPDRNILSSLLTKSFNQALTAEEGNALYNLQTMTHKIPLSGSGLGSVSMMNRLVGDSNVPAATNKKKYRLEALAASRERRLETDSESEDEAGSSKARPVRKMSRSWTSTKNELKEKNSVMSDDLEDNTETFVEEDDVVKVESENAKVNLSSSSADPGSSSNANTNSSAAPSSDGSLLKNQWPSQTELQGQIEDKCREIERLKASLLTAEDKLENMEVRIASIVGLTREGMATLREELSSVRGQVGTERQKVLADMAEITKKMMDSLQELELLSKMPDDQGKETELASLRSKLETEMHKLDDCHREIDIYRHQLEQANRALDDVKEEMKEVQEKYDTQLKSLKSEHESRLEELRLRFKSEKSELKQALELEHELELDNFKEKQIKIENQQQKALSSDIEHLELKLKSKETEIEDLQAKINHQEEDMPGADFNEKLSQEVTRAEDRLKAAHKKELEELKQQKNEEMLQRMEEVRQKMLDSSQLSVERMKTKLERQQLQRLAEKEEELRVNFASKISEFEDAKQFELEEAKEKVRKKSKMEIETLRSRFKMMQATGTMERSPSVSESEFTMESPRLGSMEHIGSCEERLRWEQERDRLLARIKELQTEKEATHQAVSGARSKEKLRSSAENQVMFNEAIRKVIEEKDKKISSLELSLNEKLNPNNQSLIRTLEDQLAEVQRTNAQLESELSEAQNKLKQQMTCSVMPVEASDSVKQLQEENQKLKQELSRSASSLVSGGRVSVTSADRGDLVLVIWSEEFSNYQIYQEGPALHFLHTDSRSGLELVDQQGNRKKHITAEVVEKEYCQAKKAENRFKVKQGTKFYRVKCKLPDRSSSSGDTLVRSLAQSQPL